MYLRLRCDRGAPVRSTYPAFVKLLAGWNNMYPVFFRWFLTAKKGLNPEAISMQSHEAIAAELRAQAAGLLAAKRPISLDAETNFDDGALESEHFSPCGVLN